MTLFDAVGCNIVKTMEVGLLRDISDGKDVNIDERILDIMRVAAIFDGREDDFERWVTSQKIAN